MNPYPEFRQSQELEDWLTRGSITLFGHQIHCVYKGQNISTLQRWLKQRWCKDGTGQLLQSIIMFLVHQKDWLWKSLN